MTPRTNVLVCETHCGTKTGSASFVVNHLIYLHYSKIQNDFDIFFHLVFAENEKISCVYTNNDDDRLRIIYTVLIVATPKVERRMRVHISMGDNSIDGLISNKFDLNWIIIVILLSSDK